MHHNYNIKTLCLWEQLFCRSSIFNNLWHFLQKHNLNFWLTLMPIWKRNNAKFIWYFYGPQYIMMNKSRLWQVCSEETQLVNEKVLFTQTVNEIQTWSDVASFHQLVCVVSHVAIGRAQSCIYVAWWPDNGDTLWVEQTHVLTLLQCFGCPMFCERAAVIGCIGQLLPLRWTAFIHQSHRYHVIITIKHIMFITVLSLM